MSDGKRVVFTTIGDVKKSSNSSTNQSTISQTIRLELKLFEANADSFPEFNYSKLLHVEKKKRKKLSKLNGFNDPLEENDDDVARLAKELERKYGNNSAYGKKFAGRSNSEYYDKGAGYDESDSFIDNTEAYDELIPDEVETVGGGFYINSGPLEFKHLSNYERPEDAMRMPKPKKRILSSSSESSEDDMRDEGSDSGNQSTSSKHKNGHVDKKQKVVNLDEQVSKPAKIPKMSIEKDRKTDKVKKDSNKNEGVISDSGKEKVIKTTTVKDMLRAKRDNLRNIQDSSSYKKTSSDNDENLNMEKEISSTSDISESSDEESDQSEDKKEESKNSINGDEDGQVFDLPTDLSEELLQNIILLKEISQTITSIGKSNFFDSRVTNLLLKVEQGTRVAGGHVRNQVYSYLEKYLPISKQTLMLRAKKLRIEEEERKVKIAFIKLKTVVDSIMPHILVSYETEFKRVNELRSSMDIIGIPDKQYQLKLPRKRFPWDDITRNLLYELIAIQKFAHSIVRPRKESLNEYLENYLKSEILPIWPQGWMKIEELNKEIEKKKLDKMQKISKNDRKLSDNSKLKEKTDLLNLNQNHLEKIIIGTNQRISSSNKTVANSTKGNISETQTDSNNAKKEKCDTKSTNATGSYNSSLTITPVMPIAGGVTKLLPAVQNKVTITNIDNSKNSSSGSPSIPNNATNSSNVASSHLPSSLSISISPSVNSTNTSSTSNVNSSVSNKSKSSAGDSISSSKKSTDYSINSIMSSTSNTTTPLATSAAVPSLANLPQTDTKLTTIINLDDLKTKSDLINASLTSQGSIKVRSVANMNNSVSDTLSPPLIQQGSNVVGSHKSVESDSNSSDGVEIIGVFPVHNKKPGPKSKTFDKIKVNKSKYIKGSTMSTSVANTSSSGNSVNVINNSLNVGVIKTAVVAATDTSNLHRKSPGISPTSNITQSQHKNAIISSISKDKYVKAVERNENKGNKSPSKDKFNKSDREDKWSTDAPVSLSPSDNYKDADLDVNQIMKELKELQELQSKCSSVNSLENNLSHPNKLPSSSHPGSMGNSHYSSKKSSDAEQNSGNILNAVFQDVIKKHNRTPPITVIERSFNHLQSISRNHSTNPIKKSCDFPISEINTSVISTNFLIPESLSSNTASSEVPLK